MLSANSSFVVYLFVLRTVFSSFLPLFSSSIFFFFSPLEVNDELIGGFKNQFSRSILVVGGYIVIYSEHFKISPRYGGNLLKVTSSKLGN